MKHTLLFILTVFTISSAFAQANSAVVFSENGEAFTLLLNGVKQNEQPSANVQLDNLDLTMYQARIDFEDETLADFSNNNFALHPGFKVTYMVKINRKGKYVLRFQGETPYSAADMQQPEATQIVVPVVEEEVVIEEVTAPSVGSETTVTQTVSTTSRTSTPGSSDKVSIEMSAPGVDIGFKMNVDMDVNMEVEEETTFTQETTVIEQSTIVQEPSKLSKPKNDPVVIERSGDGCAFPESENSFTQIKKSISSKDFEDSKMTIAKQIVKNKCMTSQQVKELMELFTYEETKLDFAMFAYDHTYDQDNYYVVNDAFEFELTIDELNEFLESK